MVTHDRYFLDSVCNRIVEIDKGKFIVIRRIIPGIWN